ncbi:hypothetical protein [Spirulina sp. 06S082]|uniref:hypothetical protein n=1 Tax=Spirulina sp. 06S082 TaxID=3110248 RepID=UPI002B2051AD|nr:hypothetical protein [Spirulina sp. 06S082]MEA5468447.1 hypothetical protein [Spirulina sp. 06S082]
MVPKPKRSPGLQTQAIAKSPNPSDRQVTKPKRSPGLQTQAIARSPNPSDRQ